MNNILKLLLAGIVMSFAWPVRGQFGHEQGATICGALATFVVCAFIALPQWRKGFAQSAIFAYVVIAALAAWIDATRSPKL